MRSILFVLVVAATGCDRTPAPCSGDVCDAPPPEDDLPAAICNPGTRWQPGTVAFREATAEWGLESAGGARFNVADVDGDGYPDLMARSGGTAPEDLSPEGTRRTWLLRNEAGHGFTDVTIASGLLSFRGDAPPQTGRPIEIAVFGDVDADGDLDAYVGLSTADPDSSLGERSAILLNDGAGRFSFAPDSDIAAGGRVDAPAGASFLDYDRDGHLDLFVPQHEHDAGSGLVFPQDRLFRGDGTGAFVDVTDEAALTTADWHELTDINGGLAHSRAWGSAACDLDGDGNVELLVPSYGRSPNHLWRGSADGTFENRSVASGYAYDGDQSWRDNQFARCYCVANPAADGCADIAPPRVDCSRPGWVHERDREPFRLGGNSATARCFDVDNDGDLDVLTGEIRHWWAGMGSDAAELLVNEGGLLFSRPGNAATGLAVDHGTDVVWDEGHMTNAVFDFDNDGWADVYVGGSDYPGNRGHLFHQDSALSFTELEVDEFFEHNRSHGVVVADFDRDGDLDVVVGHSRNRCHPDFPNDCYERGNPRFFENVTPPGNFLRLRLVGGEATNRGAVGARVTVRADGIVQTQEVDGGHGHFGGQADPVLHFGLGTACEAEVEVRWPDAELSTETYRLPGGHQILLVQGEAPRADPPR